MRFLAHKNRKSEIEIFCFLIRGEQMKTVLSVLEDKLSVLGYNDNISSTILRKFDLGLIEKRITDESEYENIVDIDEFENVLKDIENKDKNDTNKNSESNEQNEQDEMHLAYTRDVMEIMTRLRKDWGMKYPEEE